MRKISFFVTLLLLILVLIPSGYSQQEDFTPMQDEDKFRDELTGFNRETNTLMSDFRQVKHLDILTENIISRGKFYFMKENKLRWEYTDPFDYTIIFNGNDILIRDEDRESQYNTDSNRMFRQISRLMSNVIRGEILEEKEEFSVDCFENKREYLIVLTPTTEQYQQFFQKIEVHFGQHDMLVKKVKFIEQSEDYTLIEFFNEKRNETIPDSIFLIQ